MAGELLERGRIGIGNIGDGIGEERLVRGSGGEEATIGGEFDRRDCTVVAG